MEEKDKILQHLQAMEKEKSTRQQNKQHAPREISSKQQNRFKAHNIDFFSPVQDDKNEMKASRRLKHRNANLKSKVLSRMMDTAQYRLPNSNSYSRTLPNDAPPVINMDTQSETTTQVLYKMPGPTDVISIDNEQVLCVSKDEEATIRPKHGLQVNIA